MRRLSDHRVVAASGLRAWPYRGLHPHSLVSPNAQRLSVGVRGPSGQEAGPGSRGGGQGGWPWALPSLSKLDLGGEGSRRAPGS